MANPVLFQWGPIQFQVFPLSMQDYAHHTAADWAKKEIAGAALYREWVGEGEEQITVKGKVFPHFFARQMRNRNMRQPIIGPGASLDPDTGLLHEHTGGMPSSGGLAHLDMLDNMRRLGQAHILIRGDGWHFGWFIIESLNRAHSHIHRDGVGQQIDFEASFQRVPIPNDPASGVIQIYSSGAAGTTTA
jgi:phage protein U